MDMEIQYYGVYDIGSKMLRKRVGPLLNITHLAITKDEPKTKYNAVVWGAGFRLLTAMPVSLNRPNCPTQINVIFRVDTGAPTTILAKDVIEALFDKCP